MVAGGGRIISPIRFRGNERLVSGELTLITDERGMGSFSVAVDLEGGHRDITAGRLDWGGSHLRRLRIETDGLEGTRSPTAFTGPRGRTVGIQPALEHADFDVAVQVEAFRRHRHPMIGVSAVNKAAESHATMEVTRTRPADRLHVHVLVCSYFEARTGRNVLGIMYGCGRDDRNRSPGDGLAVFYNHGALGAPANSTAVPVGDAALGGVARYRAEELL